MLIIYAFPCFFSLLVQIVHKKTAAVLCLTTVKNEDKLEFSKILEAIKVERQIACFFCAISFYVTVPLLIWLNFVTGQFQWQVWWAQEEMGRWDHGLQITGQNQSQGETAVQGSFPEDELAYDTTQRFWVLFVEQYYFPIFCFPWLDFIWAVHCNEWMIFLPSGHLQGALPSQICQLSNVPSFIWWGLQWIWVWHLPDYELVGLAHLGWFHWRYLAINPT